MDSENSRSITRRTFIGGTGMAAGIAVAVPRGVSIVADPGDAIASAPSARWAALELERALKERGVTVRRAEKIGAAPAGDLCIVTAGAANPAAHVKLHNAPEALALAPGRVEGRPVTLACGSDARGLVYALLDLADRVRYAPDPLAALALREALVEKPANTIRSIARCFVSDVEDKPWFYDRAMWAPYLSMLAAHRFNRFSLTLGLGYDFPRNCSDVYLYFAYPFLVSVPGYDVRVTSLPDAERDRNLETLRFISEETVARGLHFQLALWTHAYEWLDSPRANYTIQGLTPRNHAAYCRDALLAVLKACPRDRRSHLPRPRRKWSARTKLRVLDDRLRRNGALRPESRNRHARQGHGPENDRRGARDRTAGERLAEVLGRAHGASLSPGGHS